jgi:hypothetical protein
MQLFEWGWVFAMLPFRKNCERAACIAWQYCFYRNNIKTHISTFNGTPTKRQVSKRQVSKRLVSKRQVY